MSKSFCASIGQANCENRRFFNTREFFYHISFRVFDNRAISVLGSVVLLPVQHSYIGENIQAWAEVLATRRRQVIAAAVGGPRSPMRKRL